MVSAETHIQRKDIVSKGKFMQIRPTVKLLTHAISQCTSSKWDGAATELPEQTPPKRRNVQKDVLLKLKSEPLH